VLVFVAAFGLLTLGLVAGSETVRPEWRDPEYGHRYRAALRWQTRHPDRPLVLVLGSSRTQMGVAPGAMDFPDEPGSPVVYNFGYRGAHPLGAWLQVSRALDARLRPRAVLIQIGPLELATNGTAEDLYGQVAHWENRFSAGDIRRLGPYTQDPTVFRNALAVGRRNSWVERHEALVSDLIPWYQTQLQQALHGSWEGMDRYGFHPALVPGRGTAEFRQRVAADLKNHALMINGPLGHSSDRVLRDTIARLQKEGIAVALFWAPEGPMYRNLYAPGAWARWDVYGQTLARECGVPLFPMPEHLTDAEFIDGYHLAPEGAPVYSRWLADHHLKPWFAQVLK